MRQSWILILALFSVTACAQLAFIPSSSETGQVCIRLGERLVKVPCAAGVKPLSWSIDGRWLVLGEGLAGGHYKLSLVDTSAAEPRARFLQGEYSAPSWSPDGKRFVYESVEKGILIHHVSGPGYDSTVPLPKGKNPSWSPHGDRIAVLPNGAETGVILCNEKGQHERHLASKLKVTRLAWAPDGQMLAVVSSGGVWLLSISGQTPDRLSDADDAHLEFSPDGAHLLCQVDGAWGTLEIATKEWKALPVEFSSPPTWEGSHQVVGVSQEHFVDLGIGHPDHDPALPDVDQTIAAFVLGHGTFAIRNPAVALKQPTKTAAVKANRNEASPISYPPSLTSRSGGLRGRRVLEYDGVSRDTVVVPMLFPVCGKVEWSDTFLTSRDGGGRRHHGQDLMAPKMRPLVAAFDGVVKLTKAKGHNIITLTGDDGWAVTYMHVNNDTPGTEDCAGTALYAFAPGLRTGDRVVRGQLVGFCGNSGNAKGGPAHCHFELADTVGGGILNALASLHAASHVDEPITIDPCPNLKPMRDEVRWDIVVRSLDRERGIIVGELISKTVDGELKVNIMPLLVRIKPSAVANIRSRTTPSEPRSLAGFTLGSYLSAIGLEPEPGKALEAREVALGASSRN